MSGSQTTAPHATGIIHPEKSASVGIVARGIHIREEKLSALLMENYVVGVGSKTTLKLYLDPKIPTRETSPRIRNVRGVQNLVDEKSSSEELDDIAYTFSVNSTSKEQSQPMFKIIVHETTVTIIRGVGSGGGRGGRGPPKIISGGAGIPFSPPKNIYIIFCESPD